MKNIISFALAVLFCLQLSAQSTLNSKPDSIYLLSYSTTKNRGHNGLHYAWSHDGKSWHKVSNEFSFVRSDYGSWGSQKRMLSPFVFFGNDGQWHAVWSLNEVESRFAHASSSDLISWRRQSYPDISEGNFLDPVVEFDSKTNLYSILFKSGDKFKKVTTKDFKSYSGNVVISESSYQSPRKTFEIEGENVSGIVHRVSWWTLDKILNHAELKNYKNLLYGETTSQDAVRFAGLKPVDVSVKAVPENEYEISDMLIGIFYEDINYASDGGLYAELVQNRSFEYTPADKNNHDQSWTHSHSWSLSDNSEIQFETASPIHPNNPTYAVLDVKNPGVALSNNGFAGIVVKQGEKYDFTVFMRQISGKTNRIKVRLTDENGKILAESKVKNPASKWSKQEAVLIAKAGSNNAVLQFIPTGHGKLAVDMVSLFPQKTFKGRKTACVQT